jgi:DNA repair protein RecO (recombination protein O)
LYGDADKIYTLLSRDKGKIHALAKGVRKITSRRGGNLDTANHVMLGITENNTGFKTITEVTTLNSFSNLKTDMHDSAKVFYILELLNKFLDDNDEVIGIFEITLSSLKSLNNKYALSKFELGLLKNLGYQMTLNKCVTCGKSIDSSWTAPKFNYSLAGVVCGTCEGKGASILMETVHILNALSSSKILPNDININSQQAEGIISHFVRDVLGERLKTVEIFPKI